MTDETQITARSETPAMPHTWQKALEMWDAGEMVPAFQVESEGATQEQLWGAAFNVLRSGWNRTGPLTHPVDQEWMEAVGSDGAKFTDREHDVVDSIVYGTSALSWPQMISRHVHGSSPALTIRKPKE
jgi:hypothetical protein